MVVVVGRAEVWAELERRMRELADLRGIGSLLAWDQQTSMPPAGAEARGRRLATIRTLAHDRLVDEELGRLLEQAAADTDDEAQAAMVRILRRDRDRAARLPTEFVRRLALARSRGFTCWRRAREARDFSLFAEPLAELVRLKREQADLIGFDGGERYDALLEDFEPGMRTARLEPLLRALAAEVSDLLDRIRPALADRPDPPFAGRRFPDAAQWDFTLRVLGDLGYDFAAGRQDRSAHPFTISPALRDVRVTTRVDEEQPFSALYSTIHECGHALYEQGFNPRYEDTPLAEAPSLGAHESQSRLWENLVGRSRPFWEHYAPLAREAFPEALAGAGVDDLFRAVNEVCPSLIRVEADEVTYNLHILVRFELELALLRGDLEAAGLPEAWDDAYERLLGVRPAHAGEGVLQDVHWSEGSFGYFPTYTLGNLYAAMLWERIDADLPDVAGDIAAGRFEPLLAWLREHVHRPGHLWEAEDLMRRITGSDLTHEPFVRYLRAKFEPLYGLSDG